MKYEMIFGDAGLFDGAGLFTGIDVVTRNVEHGLYALCRLSNLTNDELKANPVVAMRRIIKTPVISGDIDDLIKDEFSEWWEKEGCLVRSGGGDRERTFAFAAFRKLMPEILAARGLKKTPTWTMEDQKAGKSPEVGCRVNFCHKLNTNWRTGEIKYIDDQVTVIKADDIDRPFVYEFNRVEFKPIETPEEKAARLREEWVSTATSMTTYEIYDQLLSGDLPVPVKGE